MLPFIHAPSLRVAGYVVSPFWILVAAAVFVGVEAYFRFIAKQGLNLNAGVLAVLVALVGGFLGSHVAAVLFYSDFTGIDWRAYLSVWNGMSSLGGIIVGLAAFCIALRCLRISPGPYVEALAFSFPFAWLIGRLACVLAHDHPGTLTASPFGVSLRTPAAEAFFRNILTNNGLPVPSVSMVDLAFHDLAIYEVFFVLLVAIPGVLKLRSRRLHFLVLTYCPVRFSLDFLRIGDMAHWGLTFAQWVCILAVCGCVAWQIVRLRLFNILPNRTEIGGGEAAL